MSRGTARRSTRWLAMAVLVSLAAPVVVAHGASAQTEGAVAEVAPTPVTSWGSAGSGPGQFSSPGSVAVGPDGTVYVGDGAGLAGAPNRRVQAFTGTGTFLRTWGAPVNEPGPGEFAASPFVRVAPDGTVYGRDYQNPGYRVQRFTSTGTFLDVWAHGFPFAFSAAGNPLVVIGNDKVREVTTAGATVRQWTVADAGSIASLAVGADGKVFASYASATNNAKRIAVFSAGGTLIRSFTVGATGPIAVHPDGYVLIAAFTVVYRYKVTGMIVDQWSAAFATDVAVYDNGDIAIVEALANQVRVVRPVGPSGWTRRADARIGNSGAANQHVGNNIYNLTGANQSKTSTTCSGPAATSAFFVFNIQNDGNVADRFTVKSPAGTSRFRVTFRGEGATVTSRVVAGTYKTPALLPGEVAYVQVDVVATSGTPRGASITQKATIASVADPLNKDVVKYTATYLGRC